MAGILAALSPIGLHAATQLGTPKVDRMGMSEVKLVDLHREYVMLKPEIDRAIAHVLETTSFIRGPEVSSFEQAFGAYLGVKHIIGCGSGTDALQIAYMALGIGPGDEIVTTPFTFVATVEALVLLEPARFMSTSTRALTTWTWRRLRLCLDQHQSHRAGAPLRAAMRDGLSDGNGEASSNPGH
jgi:hypothetical protein